MRKYTIFLAGALMLSCSVPTGDFSKKITYNNLERGYFLHVPTSYDGDKEAALVIVLHFYGGTGEAMSQVTGLNVKSDEAGFIAVYPDAYGESWQDSDVGFVEALIDKIQEEYSIDKKRIFVTGYSNGAALAHLLACKSNKIASAAPVAGGLMYMDFSSLTPDAPRSTIHFHARDDSVFPYNGDAYSAPVEVMMAAWAKANGCDLGPDSFYNGTGALRQTWSRSDGASEIVLWTTNEGDHGWPETSSPHKLDANDLIWEFFENHPLK